MPPPQKKKRFERNSFYEERRRLQKLLLLLHSLLLGDRRSSVLRPRPPSVEVWTTRPAINDDKRTKSDDESLFHNNLSRLLPNTVRKLDRIASLHGDYSVNKSDPPNRLKKLPWVGGVRARVKAGKQQKQLFQRSLACGEIFFA